MCDSGHYENAENVYERAQWSNNQVQIGGRAPQRQSNSNDRKAASSIETNKWVKAILVVLVIGILVIVGSQVLTETLLGSSTGTSTNSENTENPNAKSENPVTENPVTEENPRKSCRDLRRIGNVSDGFHDIKLDHELGNAKVFCDMTTDGGGWTLVASVHENDIKKKCDADDLWADYIPREKAETAGKGNWENKMMFGNAYDSTGSDYKSPAYHMLEADDIMIWHVFSNVPTTAAKSTAILRYRTTNNFLREYGGNLHSLYNDRYPLKVISGSDFAEMSRQGTKAVLDKLVQSASVIKSRVPDWYEYQYGNRYPNRIVDSQMYSSWGNLVYWFTKVGHRTSYGVNYGEYGRMQNAYFTSSKSHPFFTVAAIHNEDQRYEQISIRVQSDRHSGDVIKRFGGTLTRNNYKLQYHAIHFAQSGYPTVCELHFLVSSNKEWNSKDSIPFEIGDFYNPDSGYKQNEFRANGSPFNVVMGYTLLSRKNGKIMTSDQAENVASEILQAISSIPDLFRGTTVNQSLSIPVTFDKGSKEEMLGMIPPTYRPFVHPGFVMFRAYNLTGYPNALCPGIKTFSVNPEYICIGGKSSLIGDHGTCGDFAGWEGKEGDVAQANLPVGSSHSLKDIFSTILIFYR